MENNNKLVIISQNMNGNGLKTAEDYTRKYDAGIYAFQEFHEGNSKICRFGIPAENEGDPDKDEGRRQFKRLWKKYFPWLDCKSGYWVEQEIEIGKHPNTLTITLINVHVAGYWTSTQPIIQYILVQRLAELKKSFIVVGDFNEELRKPKDKEEEKTWKNFPLYLTENRGCREVLGARESEPHHTFLDKGRGKQEGFKLDHIFVSTDLDALFEFKLEYLDEVNENAEILYQDAEGKDTAEISHEDADGEKPVHSDHTGLKLTITKKKSSGNQPE